MLNHLLTRTKSSSSLHGKSEASSVTPSSTTPSDQKLREVKSASYAYLSYVTVLATKGSLVVTCEPRVRDSRAITACSTWACSSISSKEPQRYGTPNVRRTGEEYRILGTLMDNTNGKHRTLRNRVQEVYIYKHLASHQSASLSYYDHRRYSALALSIVLIVTPLRLLCDSSATTLLLPCYLNLSYNNPSCCSLATFSYYIYGQVRLFTDTSKSLCQILLEKEQTVPQDFLFHNDVFGKACRKI